MFFFPLKTRNQRAAGNVIQQIKKKPYRSCMLLDGSQNVYSYNTVTHSKGKRTHQCNCFYSKDNKSPTRDIHDVHSNNIITYRMTLSYLYIFKYVNYALYTTKMQVVFKYHHTLWHICQRTYVIINCPSCVVVWRRRWVLSEQSS